MTPEQLAARNAAIRAAWDDPLRRALMRAKKEKPDSRSSSREAYNAYFRNYRARAKMAAALDCGRRLETENGLRRARLAPERPPILKIDGDDHNGTRSV